MRTWTWRQVTIGVMLAAVIITAVVLVLVLPGGNPNPPATGQWMPVTGQSPSQAPSVSSPSVSPSPSVLSPQQAQAGR
jgi:hypothetical protein